MVYESTAEAHWLTCHHFVERSNHHFPTLRLLVENVPSQSAVLSYARQQTYEDTFVLTCTAGRSCVKDSEKTYQQDKPDFHNPPFIKCTHVYSFVRHVNGSDHSP